MVLADQFTAKYSVMETDVERWSLTDCFANGDSTNIRVDKYSPFFSYDQVGTAKELILIVHKYGQNMGIGKKTFGPCLELAECRHEIKD